MKLGDTIKFGRVRFKVIKMKNSEDLASEPDIEQQFNYEQQEEVEQIVLSQRRSLSMRSNSQRLSQRARSQPSGLSSQRAPEVEGANAN